jgi:hypothetical protein
MSGMQHLANVVATKFNEIGLLYLFNYIKNYIKKKKIKQQKERERER